MGLKTTIVIVWALSFVVATAASESQPVGDTYALIVTGVGKDPEDRLARDRTLHDFRAFLLEKAAVAPDRLVVLTPDASAPNASTAVGIERAIETFASAANPTDRFILYYLGQANVVGDMLRLNLPGPDATHEELAKWLAGVKARTQLVVLDCPRAAAASETLARPGRVILFASTAEQAYGPRFGSHFVPALARPDSDANHDGRISVLEAFAAAAREIEQWYQQKQLLPTETPCLDDDGDGKPSERPWRYEQDGADGRSAAGLFLAPKA